MNKTNHNPGWKAKARAIRREAAEKRQAAYAALPLSQKLKNAGPKERRKLEARHAE